MFKEIEFNEEDEEYESILDWRLWAESIFDYNKDIF